MAEELLIERTDEGVLTMTMERAAAGNAITPELRDSMIDVLDMAGSDEAVRCIVITGAGDRHFCTGADLRARAARDGEGDVQARRPGDVGRSIRDGVQALALAVLDCEKPVIAAVNGTAAGAGFMLVLAADLAIASDRARLVPAFVRRGLIPDGGVSYLLSRSVGAKLAKEIILLGDDLSADEAHRLGLVNKVVPHEQLTSSVDHLAQRLAAGPTVAISQAKKLLNGALEGGRGTALDAEAASVELVVGSEDATEGMAAFVERRSPAFRGR